MFLTICYFDALAGAGKTRALAREADRRARLGGKVLFVQPTKTLIDNTIKHELRPLNPGYPLKALHGETSPSVVGDIVRHFKECGPGGEVLFITHAAFLLEPYLENKSRWSLIFDEVPQVDRYEERKLPETHSLLTPYLEIAPFDALYCRLLAREDRE